MKRLLEISLLSFLTTVLLSSGTAAKNSDNGCHGNLPMAIGYDTTDLVRLVKVDSFKLSIIPPSTGVQFYKDGIVFLSSSKYEKKMSPNQISFGSVEAYYAPVKDSVLGKHMIFSPLSSFSFPCEAMTFSRDYNTVYFTKFPKKDKKEKIYMAKFSSNSKNLTGLVSETVPLEFCKDNFNYTHPALSVDGEMLVFASDREGSLGGMDLFVSRKTGEKWSAPENLGKSINTTGNEFFPFLDPENNLYFSSDGLPGYGGYDVFTCKFNGINWDKPKNLSDRINSNNDDISFTVNKMDGKMAFFTRRQKSGKGDMQLFRVSLKQGVVEQNLLTISYVFNGKPVEKTSLLAVNTATEVKPDELKTSKTKSEPEVVKKEDIKVSETTPVLQKVPEKGTVSKPEPVENKPDANVVVKKPAISTNADNKDVVIFRIQFMTSSKPRSEKEIIINGKTYKLFEYFYLGAYRYTIGEFSTLSSAAELQKTCRQAGYPQAFVAAFKNNTRILDLKSIK